MVPMNGQEYDLLRSRFGADLDDWPEADARRAVLYLESDVGSKHARADAALDALLAGVGPVPGDSDAFMAKLMDIPASATAQQQPHVGLLARLFGGLSSRAAFASQAAVYVIVLGVGIIVGMQGEAPEAGGEAVDLSAHLFASNADLYLED
jgi:hypothetical protein